MDHQAGNLDTKIIRKYRDAESLPAMNRRLGSSESIYYLLDQLYCLNFAVFAEISGSLDVADLNAALQVAQQEKPLLRARIALQDGRPWFEAVSVALAPLRAEILPLRNWRTCVAKQLSVPFDGGAPLARCIVFRGAGSQSVVAMVFHHAIADGKSGARLLMDVLRRAGGEHLPVALQAARPSAQDIDPIGSKGALEGAAKKLGFWLRQGQTTLKFAKQLPGYDPCLQARRCIKAIHYAVPRKQGVALLAACREHGTTVHGALGAAQLLAISSEFGGSAERNLALNSLADLRGVLGENLSAHDLGLYIATLTTVHAVAARADLWQLAQDIKSQLSAVLNSGEADLIHTMYPQDSLLPVTRHSARLVQAAVSLGPNASMLTNIGNLEAVALLSGARVRSVAFMVSPPPQHPICVTVSGYAGGLHLHLLYDQTKLADAQANRIGNSLIGFIAAAVAGLHPSTKP